MAFWGKYKHGLILIIVAGIILAAINQIAVIWSVLKTVTDAAIPLLLGIFIAFIMNIIVNRYERIYFRKSSRNWVVKSRRSVCTIAAIITVIVTVGFVLRMAIPQTVHSISMAVVYFPSAYAQVMDWVKTFLHQIPYLESTVINSNWSEQNLLDNLTGSGSAWAGQFVSKVGDILSWIINGGLAFFFALYLLFNKDLLRREGARVMEAYCKPETMNKVFHVITVFRETFSSFFVGQFLDAIILGLMVTIGMLVFQIPYATNIGCVIGLTALIPMLGAYIGAAIGVTMLLVESPFNALIFLIILVIMQQIEGNFIYPKIVGGSIGLPGIWVFAAVVLGGGLFGIIGILLSVPVVAAFYKLLWENVEKHIAKKQQNRL